MAGPRHEDEEDGEEEHEHGGAAQRLDGLCLRPSVVRAEAEVDLHVDVPSPREVCGVIVSLVDEAEIRP